MAPHETIYNEDGSYREVQYTVKSIRDFDADGKLLYKKYYPRSYPSFYQFDENK